MPGNVLAINTGPGSGDPQLKIYNGVIATPLGAPVGATETSFLISDPRAIRFGNNQDIYVMVGPAIYRSTDNGNSWSVAHTLVSLSTATERKWGLYIVYVGGRPAMFTGYQNTSVRWVLVRSFDGITWETYTTAYALHTNYANACWHNNLLILNSLGSGGPADDGFIGVNPATMKIAFSSTVGFRTSCSIEYNSRLIVSQSYPGTQFRWLQRVSQTYSRSPTSYDLTLQLVSGLSSVTNLTALLVDNGFLYYFVFYNTSVAPVGWQVFKYDSSGSEIGNFANPVIPTNFRVGDNTLRGAKVYIDQTTNPPTKYLIFFNTGSFASVTQNTSYAMYRWNGDATEMTFIGFGGNSNDILGIGYYSSGETQFTNEGRTVTVESKTIIPDTQTLRLFFTISSPNVGESLDVIFYYGLDNSTPSAEATLSNPSSGVLVGNTITGLIADNGATTYQVTWNAGTDGVTSGDIFNILPQALLP